MRIAAIRRRFDIIVVIIVVVIVVAVAVFTSIVDTEKSELNSIFIERAYHDWIATRLAFRAKCFRKLSDIVP